MASAATKDCCLMDENGQTRSRANTGNRYFTAGPVDMSLIFDIKLICLKHFPEKLAIDCDA